MLSQVRPDLKSLSQKLLKIRDYILKPRFKKLVLYGGGSFTA